MYDLISGIIDHHYVTGDSMQNNIIYTCCILICILVVIFADAIRSVFSRFMFAGKK